MPKTPRPPPQLENECLLKDLNKKKRDKKEKGGKKKGKRKRTEEKRRKEDKREENQENRSIKVYHCFPLTQVYLLILTGQAPATNHPSNYAEKWVLEKGWGV